MSKRAIGYARVSTHDQALKGNLDDYVRIIERYARDQDFLLLDVITDEISGTIPIPDRPGGSKLYDSLASGGIDVLILPTHDRVARDDRGVQYLLLKADLESYGVELHFADTGIDRHTPEDDLIGYVKSWAAAKERRDITKRTHRRIRSSMENDGHLIWTGPPKYGFKKLDKLEAGQEGVPTGLRDIKYLVIDESQAEVVRRLFELRTTKGLSYMGIARVLTEEGIPSPSGKDYWSRDMVKLILNDPIYTGKVIWGQTRYNKKLKKKIYNPKDQWIEMDFEELRIVSDELFELAKRIGKQNARYSSRNSKHEYLLRGRIRCGYCGRSISGAMKKGRIKYYYCISRTRLQYECPIKNKAIMAEPLEKDIWHMFSKILYDDDYLETLLERHVERTKGERDELERRLASVDRGIKRLEKELEGLLDDLQALGNQSGSAREFVRGRITNVGKQLDILQEDRKKLQARLTPVSEDIKEQARAYVKEIRKSVDDPENSEKAKRALLNLFNVEVVYHPGGGEGLDCQVHADVDLTLFAETSRLKLASGNRS